MTRGRDGQRGDQYHHPRGRLRRNDGPANPLGDGETYLNMVPVLLGDGVHLSAHLEDCPLDFECTRVVESDGITRRYRVVH